MTMDLFPLGHEGVALDRMETNRREEVFLGLKSGIRMPTMEDMIAVLSFFRTLWMIKTITGGIRHSLVAQVLSVGGVLFRLFIQ